MAVPDNRPDEPALEPDIEIVDPHHHLQQQDPPGHSYLLDDLLSDTATHGVKETIFVECAWPKLQPVEEVQLVAGWAAESAGAGGAVIRGIIGFIDFRQGAAAGRVLDEMREVGDGRLVGIRQGGTWDPSPAIRNHRTNPEPGMYAGEPFQTGFRELARRDLVFDAWLYHPQLSDAVALAQAFPDTRIVLDHLGGPLGAGPYRGRANEVDAEWKRGMALIADCPNVFLKIGGIGFDLMVDTSLLPSRPTSAQLASHWRSRVLWCIDRLGPGRCMFESNYPADEKVCTYSTIWNAFKLIVADASEADKRDLFSGTARRAYF